MKSAFVPYESRLKVIYDVLKPGYAKIKAKPIRMIIKVFSGS